MSEKRRNRMTKDTVPEGFSVSMALVDLLPVLFFGLSAMTAGRLFHSALIADRAKLSFPTMLAGLTRFPACVFFAAGALGMTLMLVFTFCRDSSDARVNWQEQTVNAAAQLCILIGLLLSR